MNNGGARRVVPIILVLIVIAIAVAAMVSIGQSIFGGNNTPKAVNEGKVSLTDTTEGRSVRMTVRGPIVADEVFNSYTITVSSTSRNLTTYVGYLDRQLETKQLQNNIPSYEQLVYALDRDGMMNAAELTGDANDLRGICSTGVLYQFDTLNNGNVIKSLWTTNCKAYPGSLKVSSGALQSLFQLQIPDYETMTGKLRI